MGCLFHLWVAFGNRATIFGQHCLSPCTTDIDLQLTSRFVPDIVFFYGYYVFAVQTFAAIINSVLKYHSTSQWIQLSWYGIVACMTSMYHLSLRAKSIGKHLCWVLLHVDTIACGMFERAQVQENHYIKQDSPGSCFILKVQFIKVDNSEFQLYKCEILLIFHGADFTCPSEA